MLHFRRFCGAALGAQGILFFFFEGPEGAEYALAVAGVHALELLEGMEGGLAADLRVPHLRFQGPQMRFQPHVDGERENGAFGCGSAGLKIGAIIGEAFEEIGVAGGGHGGDAGKEIVPAADARGAAFAGGGFGAAGFGAVGARGGLLKWGGLSHPGSIVPHGVGGFAGGFR